jgi:TonB dependent receptor-like, beta-barrel/Carboxypeptidase regulatory-like domain/TonB-dependent Receptor Plug Domain
MKIKIPGLIVLFSILSSGLFAQSAVIKGRVFNSINNEAVPFANIVLDSLQYGATSDMDGNYRIENLKPGTYNLICSFVGFKKAVFYEVMLSPAKPTVLDIPLVQESETLAEVEIKSSQFAKREESPLSLRTINATEVYRSPGGNRDISKVIQILPGVGSTLSFRNDIIVRGGAPNENRFYLDGIEVPNINHFATQGSSGGPVGMINVNFIREVDFYAGAFPANRGNALSSVMEFKQFNGNDEKLSGNIMVGSSDLGLTLDGPMGKKSTFIFSARRSYLQLLFKALALPFLPTYNDFQYKHLFKINDKNQLTLIGLGAIDDFKLNTDVNDKLSDSADINRNNYLLGALPVNEQWNYTVGAKWTHFSKNAFQTFVLSRNHLNNSATKYKDNIENADSLILNYKSQEIETKFRFENTQRMQGWKLNYGLGYENVLYTNSTFNKTERGGKLVTVDFSSRLSMNKFAAFGQISKAFFDERLALSLGLRSDFNDYSSTMANPLDQLSPRFSASYALTENLSANFNIGRYYQLPAYTVMGFRDSTNALANKENGITYIRADHIVAGLAYYPTQYSKISLEGFYKRYKNYPFLLADSISMANLGGDFGVIGNEAVSSSSDGRSYGVEVFLQQKLSSSVYGIISYTWVRSEFEDRNGKQIPSAWDNRHILNITAGKKFKKNWELGAKFRLLGGAPYTPYDIVLSSIKTVWDRTGTGIYDWQQLNVKRNPVSHGLDIRIDKKWYFKKWTLDTYLDIQNIYNFQAQAQPYIDVVRDGMGNPVEDPGDPMRYKTYEIENTSGTLLPSIGIMIEF